MEITINDIGYARKNIKFTILAEEIKKEYDKKVNELSKKSQIKGFRAGRIPKDYIEKRFGKAILEEIKVAQVNQGLLELSTVHHLQILGEPEFSKQETEFEKDKTFVFEFVVKLQPEFQLPEYKGIEIKKPNLEVSEKEIDAEMIQLQHKRGDLVIAENGIAEENDMVVCDVEIKTNVDAGEKTETKKLWEKANLMIQVGYVNLLGIPVGKQVLLGHKTGDVCEFETIFPDNFHMQEHRARPGSIRFSVKEVKRVKLPELDDEFARELGFKDLADLKEKAKEMIKANKEREAEAHLESEICKKIIEMTPLQLPDGLLDEKMEIARENFRQQLKKANFPAEKIEDHVKEQEEKLKEQVEFQLKEYLIVGKIAQQEKLGMTDEEIEEYHREIAIQQQKWPTETKKEYEESGMVEEVKYQVKMHKVLHFLLENAKLT